MSYLEVKNVSKKINSLKILKDISFSLDKGKVLVILGKSGAGKTTLLRNLNFLDFPDTGTIELDQELVYNYNSKPMNSKELQERHKLVGMVFQNFNLFPHLSVIQNVTLAVDLENKKKVKTFKQKYEGINKKDEVKKYSKQLEDETKEKAISILYELGLIEKINSYPYQLSGGEQQRVSIARALILNPKILCFDEPTSALDPGLTGEVVKIINKLKTQKQTMIIITHELDFASQVADEIIHIEKGQIVK